MEHVGTAAPGCPAEQSAAWRGTPAYKGCNEMNVFRQLLILLLALSPLYLFMFLFTWLRRSAKKQRPRENASALEFFPAPGIRILIVSVQVALVAFTILVLAVSIRTGEGWFAVFIPLSVLVAILLAKPRTITI